MNRSFMIALIYTIVSTSGMIAQTDVQGSIGQQLDALSALTGTESTRIMILGLLYYHSHHTKG